MTTRRGLFALLAGAAAAPLVARHGFTIIDFGRPGDVTKVIYEDFIPATLFPVNIGTVYAWTDPRGFFPLPEETT